MSRRSRSGACDCTRILPTPASPRSRPRHTAQEQPFEVEIRYPHHPRVGERATALRRLIYAGCVHYVIEQPNGSRVCLPAWMTESWAATLPIVVVPRLPLAALQAVRSVIDASGLLLPSTQANQGDDDGKSKSVRPVRSAGDHGRYRSSSTASSDKPRRGHGPDQTSSKRMHLPCSKDRGGKR